MRAVKLHFFPAGAILAWTPWSVFFQSLNHQWKQLESCLAWLLRFSWTTVCSWCLCLSCKSWQSLFFEQSQNNLQSLFLSCILSPFTPRTPLKIPRHLHTPSRTHLLFLFWLSLLCIIELSCCRGNSDQKKLIYYIIFYSNSRCLLQLQTHSTMFGIQCWIQLVSK